MHEVYLSLGSNLGNKEQNLLTAIRLIGERVGQVSRQSSFIETEPWGYESENTYLNAAILCQTERTPREVLLLTQQIERDMGRTTKSRAVSSQPSAFGLQPSALYKDRPIDIDILLYDDLNIDEPDLKIPHPLMQKRDFVMTPLREIMEE